MAEVSPPRRERPEPEAGPGPGGDPGPRRDPRPGGDPGPGGDPEPGGDPGRRRHHAPDADAGERGTAGVDEPAAGVLPAGVPGNLDPAAGFTGLMGLRIDEASATRVLAHLEVGPQHLQPYGLVHGGVYAAIAETLASIGGMVAAAADGSGRGVVGLENHTSFLRPARLGQRIDAEAVPRHAGRRVHQWAVTMRNARDGRELATSTVRLLLVVPDRV